ncbi:HNH endonuclease [Heyndrickxia sp. MSNUG]
MEIIQKDTLGITMEEPGVLQLVDRETHASVGHTGGRELWGGGSEYR